MSDFWDWLLHLSDTIEAGILSLVESVWIYPAIYGVSLVDAVIPMVPSESVIIATASAWRSVGEPVLALVFLAGAAGAWSGDQIAYFVGTKVDVRRIRFFRKPRVLAALDFAEQSLEKRGTLYIIAARFIPMGRVAVNLSAGALRFPRKRFMAVDAMAAVIWAGWGILIGTVAASIFHGNVVVSVIAGIVGGVVLGLGIDYLMRLVGLTPPELPDLTGEIESQYDVHPTRRFHTPHNVATDAPDDSRD